MSERIPVVVLGGSGYVAGEVVRLLAGHPGFALAAVVSESRVGAPLDEAFPHLAGTVDGLAFAASDSLAGVFTGIAAGAERCALVSAAPHGASAALVARALALFVAHPGCFTTSVLLAIVPLLAGGIAEPRFAVTAITGSTGSGRTLSDKTHHPARRSNVAAYSPLAHRHAPEMAALAAEAAGTARPEIAFVPLSGPQARGIYATIQGRLAPARNQKTAAEVAGELAAFYAACPFVAVGTAPPALTEVVGTNRARLGVACAGESFAVTVAIDNLVKGAAGGGVQWLNRIYGFDETSGLAAASLGWF